MFQDTTSTRLKEHYTTTFLQADGLFYSTQK